jgi:hypothetical protein
MNQTGMNKHYPLKLVERIRRFATIIAPMKTELTMQYLSFRRMAKRQAQEYLPQFRMPPNCDRWERKHHARVHVLVSDIGHRCTHRERPRNSSFN